MKSPLFLLILILGFQNLFFDLSGEYREEDYEDCYEGLHDFHVVSYENQNFYEHDPDLDDDDEIPF